MVFQWHLFVSGPIFDRVFNNATKVIIKHLQETIMFHNKMVSDREVQASEKGLTPVSE